MTSATAAIRDYEYSFRLSLFSKQASYRLTDKSLVWSEGAERGELAFSDIRRIRVYESPGARRAPRFRRCVITPKDGRVRVLSSNDLNGAIVESRMKRYLPFVDELLRRLAAQNPNVEYVCGLAMAAWAVFAAIFAALAITWLLAFVALGVALFEGEQIGLISFLLVLLGVVAAITLIPTRRSVRRNRPRRFDPRTENPLPPILASA